jgi:hypothetical protein
MTVTKVTLINQITPIVQGPSNNSILIGKIVVSIAKPFFKNVPTQTKYGIEIGGALGGCFGPATPITVPFFAAFGGVVGTLFWAMRQK